MAMKTFHQKVYLIRHGETEWTKSRKHTGLTDIPLTDEGRLQAEWLSGMLEEKKFKKIYCSPLLRAKETCEIAGFEKEAEILEDLVEWDYGIYEGMTTVEIKDMHPKWNIFRDGAEGGESIGDISTRAMRVIARVRDIPGDVALFSSGHFLRALGARWLHKPIPEARQLMLSTASISILGYEREEPALFMWNNTETY